MAERKRMPKGVFSATEVGTLIEELRFNFKAFGESQEDMRGRIAGLEAEVREFKDFTTFQKLATGLLRKDVSALTSMGRKNTADIAAIREDLKALRSELKVVEEKVGL